MRPNTGCLAKENNIYPFIDWDDVLKLRIHKRKGIAQSLNIGIAPAAETPKTNN